MNSRAIQKHLPLASFGGQPFLCASVLSFCLSLSVRGFQLYQTAVEAPRLLPMGSGERYSVSLPRKKGESFPSCVSILFISKVFEEVIKVLRLDRLQAPVPYLEESIPLFPPTLGLALLGL